MSVLVKTDGSYGGWYSPVNSFDYDPESESKIKTLANSVDLSIEYYTKYHMVN